MNDIHGNNPDNQRPPAPQQSSGPRLPPPYAAQPSPPPPYAQPSPPPYTQPSPPPPPGVAHDDVWGVRPPALGQPSAYPSAGGSGAQADQHGYGQHGYGQQGYGQDGYGQAGPGGAQGASSLDRGFSALQKSPLRRDSSDGIIGGVAAGIAKRMNVSPMAIRLAAVALALFFGTGIAAYLIAWALLPDESGRTHVEQGVKGGTTQSLIVVALGALAALGMLGTLLEGLGWLIPVAVTAGIVYYVVSAGKKKDGGTAG